MHSRIVTWTALCAGLLAVSPAFALSNQWTDAQKACAASIGVVLGDGYGDPDTNLRTMTWVADVVIRGTVTSVQNDLGGPYHTVAKIAISNAIKNPLGGNSITLKLVSGSSWSPQTGTLATAKRVGEPGFAVGEDVFLFLTTDYDRPASNPTAFVLGSGECTLVRNGKYVVSGTSVTSARYPNQRFSLSFVLSELSLTASKQASVCQQ